MTRPVANLVVPLTCTLGTVAVGLAACPQALLDRLAAGGIWPLCDGPKPADRVLLLAAARKPLWPPKESM